MECNLDPVLPDPFVQRTLSENQKESPGSSASELAKRKLSNEKSPKLSVNTKLSSKEVPPPPGMQRHHEHEECERFRAVTKRRLSFDSQSKKDEEELDNRLGTYLANLRAQELGRINKEGKK